MTVSREPQHDEAFQAQFKSLLERLDEQQRRWVAGLFSKSLGWGGDTTASRVSGLSPQTIRRGREELDSRFSKSPTHRVRQSGGGRPSSLDESQLKALETVLTDGASAHGWPNDLWTMKRVGAIIQRHFGLQLSRPTVRRILASISWSCQTPKQSFRESNERQVQRWKTRQFARMKKQARERKACIAFTDETGFMLAPTRRRTFAPRGQTPVNEVSDPHARISAISAVAVYPDGLAHLCFQLLDDNINFDSRAIMTFMDKLSVELNTPITVIWDSVSIHRAAAVTGFLKDYPHIRTEYFPKYASELNPADAVWAYVKFNRLANYCPLDLTELRKTVVAELARVQSRQDLLFAFIRRSKLKLWPQFLPPPK